MERKRNPRSTIWVILLAALVVLIIICASCAVLFRAVTNLLPSSEPFGLSLRTKPGPSGATLTVAYSPEKEALFQQLVGRFNEEKFKTDQGERMTVRSVRLEPEAMIEGALAGDFQASALIHPSGWINWTGTGWSRPEASRRWWVRPFAMP